MAAHLWSSSTGTVSTPRTLKPKPKPKPKPSSLVVVVYRHREHAGALGLLARVEARHVRVLERLVRDRGFGFGLIVGRGCWAPDCAYCDCADHASTYYLYLLPLLTTSAYYLYLLGACSTSGRFSGLKYMSRSTRSTAWDTYGCRLGCIRLQAGMHAVTAGAHALQPGHVRLHPGHIRLQPGAAQLQIRARDEGSVAVVWL